MAANTGKEIQIALPEELVREAEASGLMRPPEMEALLREEVRKRSVFRLFETADRLAALPGRPLTAEEVAAEVAAARRARRRNSTGGTCTAGRSRP